jgi:hypothetical protein
METGPLLTGRDRSRSITMTPGKIGAFPRGVDVPSKEAAAIPKSEEEPPNTI